MSTPKGQRISLAAVKATLSATLAELEALERGDEILRAPLTVNIEATGFGYEGGFLTVRLDADGLALNWMGLPLTSAADARSLRWADLWEIASDSATHAMLCEENEDLQAEIRTARRIYWRCGVPRVHLRGTARRRRRKIVNLFAARALHFTRKDGAA